MCKLLTQAVRVQTVHHKPPSPDLSQNSAFGSGPWKPLTVVRSRPVPPHGQWHG
ncbi:hypothetical protein BJX99DRAFT_230426 [Aspergillus californicus]